MADIEQAEITSVTKIKYLKKQPPTREGGSGQPAVFFPAGIGPPGVHRNEIRPARRTWAGPKVFVRKLAKGLKMAKMEFLSGFGFSLQSLAENGNPAEYVFAFFF